MPPPAKGSEIRFTGAGRRQRTTEIARCNLRRLVASADLFMKKPLTRSDRHEAHSEDALCQPSQPKEEDGRRSYPHKPALLDLPQFVVRRPAKHESQTERGEQDGELPKFDPQTA